MNFKIFFKLKNNLKYYNFVNKSGCDITFTIFSIRFY